MKNITLQITPEELAQITTAAPEIFLEELLNQRAPHQNFRLQTLTPSKYEIRLAAPRAWPELPELATRNKLKEKFATAKITLVPPGRFNKYFTSPDFGVVLLAANLVLVPFLFYIFINYA